MTKAQEKAQAVADRKQQAYLGKVKRLLQHTKYAGDDAKQAYTTGIAAETFAASIAAKEPVGRVVHPLKIEAVDHANQRANRIIDATKKALEEAGWDVNKVAPYPSRDLRHSMEWQLAYHKYLQVSALTTWRDSVRRGMDDKAPLLVDMNQNGCARFIGEMEKDAAWEYDLFIIKLVEKVGPVLNAVLDGSHVWSQSILTVTKAGDVKERWKTQQIENVSKLGKYFPQWPTRLLKD